MTPGFSRCPAVVKTKRVFLHCTVQFGEEISEGALNYLAVSRVSNIAALAQSSAR